MKLTTKLRLAKIFSDVKDSLLSLIGFAVCVVAVAIGIVTLINILFSCSSSRNVMTETAAAESLSALETVKDSVGSDLEMQTSASGYLDISDLQIIFYPPADVQSPVSPVDSVADEPPAVRTPQKPQILYPALLNIGRLSAGSSADAALKASNDSVGSKASDISHEQSDKDTVQRIRDPTKPSWPVLLSLFIALIIIVYTGFMLYQSNRL